MNPYMWVFVSMLIIGVGLLAVSLFAGEVSDLVGGGGDGDLTGDGLSWVSLTTVSIGLIGFGVVGLTATRYTEGWTSVLIGIIAGVVFVVIIRQFVLLPLMRQQSNSQLIINSYVGRTASVVITIPSGGWGQVRLTDNNDAVVEYRARTTMGEPINTGTRVTIDEVNSDFVLVTPVQN